mmetsp:Transcript_25439/g.28303  ORF Transcript_25439/g.28303 Transcript_25439/m.28303 type:complete len:510 (+) Transcript_25439:21-1550(+)
MSTVEIDAGDVIRLCLQFLKESNLLNTFEALQKEAQISLNTVENVDVFISNVKNGRWENVLSAIDQVKLPMAKMQALYEQIILELAELQELEVARTILRQTQPMTIMKAEQPDRYHKLEHLLARSYFDAKEYYPLGSKEKSRARLAKSLAEEVSVVPPSRLISLLGQALKYQQLKGQLAAGQAYDLFRGRAPDKDTHETYPRRVAVTIKFAQKSHPEVAAFSPDGQFLVTGSFDGFLEVWDFLSGKLRKDLKYQAEEKFMIHEQAILCMQFSRDSETIVVGSQDGKIKVWQIKTGRCLRRFPKAHTKGVTSVQFSSGHNKVLSASYDNTVRIHGLKSGKTLKIFRGHTSFVNRAIWSSDGDVVISCSSDGTIRTWDAQTTDCLQTFSPSNLTTETPIHSIHSLIGTDNIVVCDQSSTLYVMNLDGQILKTYSAGHTKGSDFTVCVVSPKCEWVYGIAEDNVLYCFSTKTDKLEFFVKLHDKEIIGACHHPHRNLLGSYSDDGILKIWKS